jgi:hypothetical protein
MAKLISQADAPVATGNPHGFSGRKVTVEFLKTNDQEPRDIFVGVNDYQAVIKRGSKVSIPEEAFDVIQRATYTADDSDGDSPDQKEWVEKQRYPYNVLARHEAGEVPA